MYIKGQGIVECNNCGHTHAAKTSELHGWIIFPKSQECFDYNGRMTISFKHTKGEKLPETEFSDEDFHFCSLKCLKDHFDSETTPYFSIVLNKKWNKIETYYDFDFYCKTCGKYFKLCQVSKKELNGYTPDFLDTEIPGMKVGCPHCGNSNDLILWSVSTIDRNMDSKTENRTFFELKGSKKMVTERVSFMLSELEKK